MPVIHHPLFSENEKGEIQNNLNALQRVAELDIQKDPSHRHGIRRRYGVQAGGCESLAVPHILL